MAKKSQKKNWRVVLAIDIGGTKVAVAAVNEQGKILRTVREPIELSQGLKGLVQQIAEMAQPLIREFKIRLGAVASAGPLDPVKGELLNPTNLKTDNQFWGKVGLIRELNKKLKIRLFLENDAAAAALAEAWVGQSRKTANSVIVTLGTGVGVGVICNGQLVRAGRHLHTELGHLLLNYADREWLCGCGNYGCAEAYLSGVNFTRKLAADGAEPGLNGPELVRRAKAGDAKVLLEFTRYGERLAGFLYSLCVAFCPERVVLSGGFSHASELFMPQTEAQLATLLRTRRDGHDLLPKILISKFQDEAGILGAARVAFLSSPR